MIYHVSVNGSDRAIGTADAPFQTINKAARVARPATKPMATILMMLAMMRRTICLLVRSFRSVSFNCGFVS